MDVQTPYGTLRAYEWTPPGVGATDPRVTVPVVLVPGRASGAPMWAENLPSLIPQRRVIVLDAIGDAGLSQQTVPITTMADQAAWLDEAIRQVAAGRVHLVGHSFGGATAAAHAARHGDRLASLTLLEPAFTMAYPPASMFFWASVMILPMPQSWRDYGTRQIAGEDGPIDRTDPLVRMIDRAAAGYSASLPVPTPLSEDDRGALRTPVYLAVAEHRSLAGGRKAVERAETFPDATVKVWPQTTHSLPMQAKEPLAAELGQFWSAHDPR